MTTLAELIRHGETTLVSRIRYYAEKTGYIKYTPLAEEVWQKSIRGFSEGLLTALKSSAGIPELSPDLDLVNDTISAYGVEQARMHQSRGVTLEMFLGLMKYFRQSYHDVIDASALPPQDTGWAYTFIERYFDRIELGFMSEWERSADDQKVRHEKLLMARNAELLEANSQLKQEILERKRAELQVEKLNVDLEKRVAVRTLQLQRINEQNNYKLKELLILNRLSSLNLSKIRLNRFTSIILAALTSNPPLFFDRAMLFLLNERTQVLQGMLGIIRKHNHSDNGSGDNFFYSDDESHEKQDTPLNSALRSSRIELKKVRGLFYRAVNEKRVIASKAQPSSSLEAPELFSRLNIGLHAIMPLMGKNGIFGVVVVDNPHSAKQISKNDLQFLQLFANHAGIAIENLMLYNSLEDANRLLKETQAQLIHGERLATIGEMAASIAHELKGPMVAIGGFARRLAKKMPPGSVEAEHVATIINEEQRLEGMLNEVLTFSKKTTICYEQCSITEIVESSLSILSHLFERTGVVVSKSFPRKEITLYADSQQLKQVFINIFHNALDVMRTGGILRVAITMSRLGKERAVAIRIADTGGGIPASLRCNIFTTFFTTKNSGTGLGLSIANRIVSNHNGKVKVRNHSAGGAEFTVLLPCQGYSSGM